MINLKEYIVTLMAMFLSLGIGILVGTSLAGSVVVEQQKIAIEQLEYRYYQALQEVADLDRDLGERDALLSLYDRAAEELLPGESLEDLEGLEVAVISLDYRRGREICDFLSRFGLKVNPHIHLTETVEAGAGEGGPELEGALEEILGLAKRLLGEGEPPGDYGPGRAAADYGGAVEPEAILLVLGGISLEERAGAFLEGVLALAGPGRLVVLEDYFLPGTPIAAGAGDRVRVIDYIDTAPGRMALLSLLSGRELKPLKPRWQGQGP